MANDSKEFSDLHWDRRQLDSTPEVVLFSVVHHCSQLFTQISSNHMTIECKVVVIQSLFWSVVKCYDLASTDPLWTTFLILIPTITQGLTSSPIIGTDLKTIDRWLLDMKGANKMSIYWVDPKKTIRNLMIRSQTGLPKRQILCHPLLGGLLSYKRYVFWPLISLSSVASVVSRASPSSRSKRIWTNSKKRFKTSRQLLLTALHLMSAKPWKTQLLESVKR